MPETERQDQPSLPLRDWQIYYLCEVAGETQQVVADKLGVCRETVSRRLGRTRELLNSHGAVDEIRRSLLPLAEKAIKKVEEKIDEGDVNVLNAYLKGTGIYVTHERHRSEHYVAATDTKEQEERMQRFMAYRRERHALFAVRLVYLMISENLTDDEARVRMYNYNWDGIELPKLELREDDELTVEELIEIAKGKLRLEGAVPDGSVTAQEPGADSV